MPTYNPMPWQVTPGKGFQLTFPGAKGAPYKNPPKKTTKTKTNLKASSPATLGANSFVSPGAGGALGKYNTQRKVPLSTTSFSNYQGAYNTGSLLPRANSFTNYKGDYNIGPSLARDGLPVPSAAPTTATEQAAAAGPNFYDMLQKLMQPKGTDYGAMIAALRNPGKIADIATPDLDYIYHRYDPMIKSAWGDYGSVVEGNRTAAVGRESASKEALKQGFAQTAADTKASFDKTNADMASFAEKLGVSDALKTEGGLQREDQANRLASLASSLGQQDLASAENLATARQANYDTSLSMGKGAEARSLADLASLVAAGQSQAELNTQGYYRDANLADAQNRSSLAQIYAGHMGQQQQNQMDMIKLWSQLKSDYETAEAAKAEAEAANNPYEELITDTYEDQPFWDSMNALAAGDPTATALLSKTRHQAGSSLPEMQKLLSALSTNPTAHINMNPFSGGKLGQLVVSDKARAEQLAAQKLLEAYNNYGGAFGVPQTKTTITRKASKANK